MTRTSPKVANDVGALIRVLFFLLHPDKQERHDVINETLQWLVIAILATPKVVQTVQDFREQDEEE